MERLNFRLLSSIVVLSAFLIGAPDTARVDLVDLTIGSPTPAIPFYHFRARIVLDRKRPCEISRLSVNGESILSYELREASEGIDLSRPFEYSSPLFAAEKNKEFLFAQAWLIGRLDWENSKIYAVELLISLNKDQERQKIEKTVQAPLSGGYWNRAWKSYKSLVITENDGLPRIQEPVEFSLVFYPDQVTDLERELRIVQVSPTGETRLLPFQVYSTSVFEKKDEIRLDESGQPRPPYWLPSYYAKIVAPVSLAVHSSEVLLAFYGNSSARGEQAEKRSSYQGQKSRSGNRE